jgi:hypothetical protein
VNWEQQAERLERISATLLDGIPIPEPGTVKYGLGLKFDVSLLPKPNPKIGSKEEKVPSSPLHAVPTLKGYGLLDVSPRLRAGGFASAGYLAPGAEGLFGIKAKVSQYAAGAGGSLAYKWNPTLTLTTDVGLHATGGSVKGAITAPNAQDEFTFKTLVFYAAPGILLPSWGLWANLLLGSKSTEAELKIPSDETTLKTKDTLQDASMPLIFQAALGWSHKATGVSAGLAYLVVPARLYMPRIHAGWIYPLGDVKEGPSPKAGSKATSKGAKAAEDANGSRKGMDAGRIQRNKKEQEPPSAKGKASGRKKSVKDRGAGGGG